VKAVSNYPAGQEKTLQLEDCLSGTLQATGKRPGCRSSTNSPFKVYIPHRETKSFPCHNKVAQ